MKVIVLDKNCCGLVVCAQSFVYLAFLLLYRFPKHIRSDIGRKWKGRLQKSSSALPERPFDFQNSACTLHEFFELAFHGVHIVCLSLNSDDSLGLSDSSAVVHKSTCV
jgi:hypothetical protein